MSSSVSSQGCWSFKVFLLLPEGNFFTCIVILCKEGLLTQIDLMNYLNLF